MADFWQDRIPTIHRLRDGQAEPIESQVRRSGRSITLILPCHARDAQSPALTQIFAALATIDWIQDVVLGLDGMGKEDVAVLRDSLPTMRPKIHLLRWDSGDPFVVAMQQNVGRKVTPGKGWNVWLGLAWALRNLSPDVLLLHDADILGYTAEIPARLALPVASPAFGYDFNKGFYARFSHQLHGRLTRLFVFPLLTTLRRLFAIPLLEDLAAYRYPLAGEVAFTAAFAREMRIVPGWGLEMAMLPRVDGKFAICQSELCAVYDHKHQAVGLQGGAGLAAAAEEIALVLLHRAEIPSRLTPETRQTILRAYRENALLAMRHSAQLALANGLQYDPEEEANTTAVFADCLQSALQCQDAPDWLPCL